MRGLEVVQEPQPSRLARTSQLCDSAPRIAPNVESSMRHFVKLARMTLLLLVLCPASHMARAQAASKPMQLEGILKEATRRSASGATRLEVEAWLKSVMRTAGIDADPGQEEGSSTPAPSPAPAPAWDVYRRSHRDTYQAQTPPATEAPTPPPVLLQESQPDADSTGHTDAGIYKLNGEGSEGGEPQGRGYSYLTPGSRESANAYRGSKERRDLPVRLTSSSP